MSRKPTICVRTCLMSMRFMTLPSRGPTAPRRLLADLALEQEHGHERVDRQRLGERGDDDHRELDLARGFRLATDCLHGAVADAAEPDARADRRQADADRQAPTKCRMEVHVILLL